MGQHRRRSGGAADTGIQYLRGRPHGEVHSPDSLPIDGNVAILMGAELTGVSDRARELADGAICVPMHGLTESLNVSVAAACILQRLTGSGSRPAAGSSPGAPRPVLRGVARARAAGQAGDAGSDARELGRGGDLARKGGDEHGHARVPGRGRARADGPDRRVSEALRFEPSRPRCSRHARRAVGGASRGLGGAHRLAWARCGPRGRARPACGQPRGRGCDPHLPGAEQQRFSPSSRTAMALIRSPRRLRIRLSSLTKLCPDWSLGGVRSPWCRPLHRVRGRTRAGPPRRATSLARPGRRTSRLSRT